MKAIQLIKYGLPEVMTLNDIPRPKCGNEDILVKVQAVGINYVDVLVRNGFHLPGANFPAAMPAEIEGIIEEMGEQVKGFRLGQRITGYAVSGYAEYALLSANGATILPNNLPVGKGMLIQNLTAQNLLGQASNYGSVLITAAAGGVGASVIRIAKLKEVKTIIGMVGSEEKADYIRSLGATETIIYTKEYWKDELEKITKEQKVDLILESVGGEIGSTLIHYLSPGGTLVFYGYSSGITSTVNFESLMPNRKIVAARLYEAPAELRERWTNEIINWIQSGELDVSLTTYPLAEAAQAHRDIENRSSKGRLILIP